MLATYPMTDTPTYPRARAAALPARRPIVGPRPADVSEKFYAANVAWLDSFYARHPEYTPGVAA